MKTPDIFNLFDLKFLLQIPLQILQLLLVIADGLGRQLPHLAIKTVLLNRIRKVQTKTPSFLDTKQSGKRGKLFVWIGLIDTLHTICANERPIILVALTTIVQSYGVIGQAWLANFNLAAPAAKNAVSSGGGTEYVDCTTAYLFKLFVIELLRDGYVLLLVFHRKTS